jgi:hypothetical protein
MDVVCRERQHKTLCLGNLMEGITWKTMEVNIKMTSSATDCGDMKLTEITQGSVHCRAFVAIVIDISSITSVSEFLDR